MRFQPSQHLIECLSLRGLDRSILIVPDNCKAVWHSRISFELGLDIVLFQVFFTVLSNFFGKELIIFNADERQRGFGSLEILSCD